MTAIFAYIFLIMKTIVFSTQDFERNEFERLNIKGMPLHFLATRLDSSSAHLAEGYDAVSVFVHDDVDADTLQVLHSCGVRLVALRGAGYNKIDVNAASGHNIKVVRVPAYSPQAIAEHAVALIMALSRKTHKAYNRVRENNFALGPLMGFNLYGKTVGIIGMGRVGTAFATIMRGFGCIVVAHDPFIEQRTDGIKYLTLDAMLPLCDIIAVHCPLTPENRYLIGQKAFDLMKHGSMLINTARGAIVNSREAIQALKSGRLGALGIDVYEDEEGLFMRDLSDQIVKDDVIGRLMAFNNVLVTPHQAFFTREAVEEIIGTTLENIAAFRSGERLVHEVLPN